MCGRRGWNVTDGVSDRVVFRGRPATHHALQQLQAHQETTDSQDGDQQTATGFSFVDFGHIDRTRAFRVFARRELVVVVVVVVWLVLGRRERNIVVVPVLLLLLLLLFVVRFVFDSGGLTLIIITQTSLTDTTSAHHQVQDGQTLVVVVAARGDVHGMR